MIKKLEDAYAGIISKKDIILKINELVDAVNGILYYAPLEMAMKAEPKPADPYAEQRKWIGKLCWFWDAQEEYKFVGILGEVADNGTYFQKNGIVSYLNCEPVKPDDDIIYKGE